MSFLITSSDLVSFKFTTFNSTIMRRTLVLLVGCIAAGGFSAGVGTSKPPPRSRFAELQVNNNTREHKNSMHFIIARLFSRFSRIHRTCMCRSSLPLQHTHPILTAPVTPKPMYPHCSVQNSERCVQNLNITSRRLTLQTLVTRIDHHLPNDSPHVRRCCSWLAATLIAGGWSSGPIRRMATRSGGIYALQRGPCARQMWCAGTCKHLCARRQVFPETCRPANDIYGSLYLQPYGKAISCSLLCFPSRSSFVGC